MPVAQTRPPVWQERASRHQARTPPRQGINARSTRCPEDALTDSRGASVTCRRAEESQQLRDCGVDAAAGGSTGFWPDDSKGLFPQPAGGGSMEWRSRACSLCLRAGLNSTGDRRPPMLCRGSRARRMIVALLAVTTTPFVANGPATAQGVHRIDERRDLWTTDYKVMRTGGPHDSGGNGDIETVSIRHRRYAVKIRMRLTQLSPYGSNMGSETYRGGVWAVIRTNDGVSRNLDFSWAQSFDDTERITAERPSASLTDRRGRSVACDMTSEMDWGTGTVYVRIPRSCLSRPRWVKVAAGSETVNFYTTTWDDALSATSPIEYNPDYRPVHQTWTRRLHRG